MKKICFTLLGLFSLFAFAFGGKLDKSTLIGTPATKAKIIATWLHGRIYVVNDPKDADFCVRVVNKDWETYLNVYVVHEYRDSFSPGKWQFVTERSLSEYCICFVNDPDETDIPIRFVNDEGEAGPY